VGRGRPWPFAARAARTELAGEASADAAVQAVHGEDGTQQRDHPAPGRPEVVDLTAAAFFDVDNTMMQGASVFHFARGLAARKYFTTGDLLRFAARQVRFRMGGESAIGVDTAREQALSFVAGRSVAEIVELGEAIYDELMADRVYPGTLAMARRHLEAGQRVWLVTATPTELAQIIARRLELTGALGTVAETTADGRYTGALVGEMLHGRAKAAAVRALAAREGLDLRRCTAYSDSVNDVPMLSVVGTAVAINPDSALRDIARTRNWQIVDYRTGRRAAIIGVPSALGAALVALAALAARRLLRRAAVR
jgi:HAD superfamily hydrolase (TIGR01490 family)